MAPLTVLEASGALSADHGATVEVRTPSRARLGLHLLAFLCWPPGSTEPDFEADGWEVLTTGVGHGELAVLRRACSDEEPALYSFAFDGALVAGDAPPMAMLVLVTGLHDAAALDHFTTAEVVAGGPDFTVAAGVATAAYSDAAFSLFYAASSSGFDDTDAKTVLEVHGEDTDDVATPIGGSLLLWWEMPEAAGVIGARTGTLLGGAPCDGTVAQFAIAASPPAQAPRWDGDHPSIGLPLVGV